jgi:hypothetical protein
MGRSTRVKKTCDKRAAAATTTTTIITIIISIIYNLHQTLLWFSN